MISIAAARDGIFRCFTSKSPIHSLAPPLTLQAVAAEFFATAIFVAVGSASAVYGQPILDGATVSPVTERIQINTERVCMALTSLSAHPSSSPPLPAPALTCPQYAFEIAPYSRQLLISMTFGLMISVLVFCTGGISGGNLNPAVTVSLTVTRKMSLLRCVSYVVAQCLGATVGAAYIRSLSPELFDRAGGAANGLVSPDVNPFVTVWTAVGGEILGTALLVFTVCAAADVGREKDNKYVGALTPLNLGFAVLAAHMFLIPIDGCSINPARSFGSAIVAGKWANHWIFWIGPLIGGPVTAMIYELVFKAGREDPMDIDAMEVATSSSMATVGSGSSGAPGGGGGGLDRGDSLQTSNASLLGGGRPSGGDPDFGSLPPPTPPHRGQAGPRGSPGRAIQVAGGPGGYGGPVQGGAGGLALPPPAGSAGSGTVSTSGATAAGALNGVRGSRVAVAMRESSFASVGAGFGGSGGEVVPNPLQSHPIFGGGIQQAQGQQQPQFGSAAPAYVQPAPPTTLASPGQNPYGFPPTPVAEPPVAPHSQSGSFSSTGDWR